METPLPIAQLAITLGIPTHTIRRAIHAYKLAPAVVVPATRTQPKHAEHLPSVILEHVALWRKRAMDSWKLRQAARARTPRIKPATTPLALEDQIMLMRQKGHKVAAIARKLHIADVAKVLEVVNRMERT